MIILHHNQKTAENFAALLRLYPDEELPTITRSTVPLLAYWRTYAERVPQLLSRLGATQSNSARLHFEMTVPSATIPSSRRLNRPSHTDLMIFTGDHTTAIEGKWKESRYETVGDWLGIEQTKNRLGVIDHWLAMIGRRVDRSLARDDFNDVVYQMVHRAASACLTEVGKMALVYQYFGASDAESKGYENDLRHFHHLLGHPASFSFFLHRCPVESTERFVTVRNSLKSDLTEPAAAIRNAVLDGELFRFTQDDVIPIHAV